MTTKSKLLLGGLLTKGIKTAYKKYRTRGGRKVADRFKKRIESFKKTKAEIPSKDMKTIIKLKSKQDVRRGIRSQLPNRKTKTKDFGVFGKSKVYPRTYSRHLLSKSTEKDMPKLLGAIGRELSKKQNKKKGRLN